jgi:hypothetical protein
MAPRSVSQSQQLDSLRLLAISRIPRCSGCPRFEALVSAHDRGRPGNGLPGVPGHCTHQVCAPLAGRWEAASRGRQPRRTQGAVIYSQAS